MILWVHQRAQVSAMTAPNWALLLVTLLLISTNSVKAAHTAFLPSLGHGDRRHDGRPLHLKG